MVIIDINKLTQILTKTASELSYRAEQIHYAHKLPQLSSSDRQIVTQLKQERIAITSLSALSVPLTSQLLKAIDILLPELQQTSIENNQSTNLRAASSHCLYVSPLTIAQNYPEIFLWGLENRILDILENYYGVPVACIGANLRRDIANQQQIGTRLWHLDGEDRNVIKIAIYLHDVGSENGPFEYISRRFTPSYRSFKHINYAITDEEMNKVVPASKWKSCLGSAGTVIFADNAKIFHHGKIPQRDRYTLFYAYTSRKPKRPERCLVSPWREGLPLLAGKLSTRQQASIWNWKFPETQS